MNRHPDQIIILEAIDGTPYKGPKWRKVYEGRCKCFLDRQAAFRTNRVMDCSYQVVIPDRNMPEIGENYKVGVKMHTNTGNRNWDLVGYVKDFARFDRVCNLYFQMVKENLIYEDMPVRAIDTEKRSFMSFEDEWIRMESAGLINGNMVMEDEVVILEFKFSKELYQAELLFPSNDPDEEWTDNYTRHLKLYDDYTEGYYDADIGDEVHRDEPMGRRIHVFVGECSRPDDNLYAVDSFPIRLEVRDGADIVYEREIQVMPKGYRRNEE